MGSPAGRKLWLDWQRGLAVLYMVEWHTWDSWRADATAQGPVHDLMAVIGGFAAPSFLYMAGMSQLLADASLERKGVPVAERRRRSVRRGLWLLGVAYLFRVVEYLLGGAYGVPGGWEGIFKVDVLNVIAVSFIAAGLLSVGFTPRVHAALAVGATAAVALLAPPIAAWHHAPSRVLDYLYSEWPRGIFYLFPWAAFCFAGSALGRLAIRPPRPVTWIALGAALFGGGWLVDRLPPFYAHQDFWRTSPCWLSMRLGIVVATSGLLQLVPQRADRWLAWLRTMGRHSLLGYFVSIELPYGVLSARLHKQLGTRSALLGVLAMIGLTWAIAAMAERHDAWKAGRSPGAGLPGAPGTVAPT